MSACPVPRCKLSVHTGQHWYGAANPRKSERSWREAGSQPLHGRPEDVEELLRVVRSNAIELVREGAKLP